MDILVDELQFYCMKHVDKKAGFIFFEKYGYYYQFICDTCCVSQEYDGYLKLSIRDILDSDKKVAIQNWPPLKDQLVLKEYQLKMEELLQDVHNDKQRDNRISTFFSALQESFISKIKKIEKFYLQQTNGNKIEEMISVYNKISKKEQLRSLLLDKQKQIYELTTLYNEQIKNQESNEECLKDQLKVFQNLQKNQFDENILNQKFDEVLKNIDSIMPQTKDQPEKGTLECDLLKKYNINTNKEQNDFIKNILLDNKQSQSNQEKPLIYDQYQTISEQIRNLNSQNNHHMYPFSNNLTNKEEIKEYNFQNNLNNNIKTNNLNNNNQLTFQIQKGKNELPKQNCQPRYQSSQFDDILKERNERQLTLQEAKSTFYTDIQEVNMSYQEGERLSTFASENYQVQEYELKNSYDPSNKRNIGEEIKQKLEDSSQYFNSFIVNFCQISLCREEQQSGIIDFEFTADKLNQSFKFLINFPNPERFQAVGIIEKKLIKTRNNNISLFPDSKSLNIVTNKGLCSKSGKYTNFSFFDNNIIQIQVKKNEIIFTNISTNKRYSQPFKFDEQSPYCPGFILTDYASIQII